MASKPNFNKTRAVLGLPQSATAQDVTADINRLAQMNRSGELDRLCEETRRATEFAAAQRAARRPAAVAAVAAARRPVPQRAPAARPQFNPDVAAIWRHANAR